MRNPLNKSRTPMNKELTPEVKAAPVIDETMHPDLQTVLKLAVGISQAEPANIDELKRGLEQAKAAQEAAAQAKEEAKNETEFNKACDDAIRAREKEEFFTRLLNRYRYTPRMDETEYFAAVDTVKGVVDTAIEEYRKRAKEAMYTLIEARRNLLKVQKDANRTLTALNRSANVLQSKYRYNVTEYTESVIHQMSGEDMVIPARTVRREDPDEWRKHAVSYTDGEAVDKALRDPHALKPMTDPYDGLVCAAWRAAQEVDPDKRLNLFG